MTGRAGRWVGSLTALAAFNILPVFPVLPLAAQTTRAEGRVIEADSAPVPGVRVVLHRVGQSVQGPVDSTLTDRRGRFRFTFRSDTATLYLLSARRSGIEYFSPPVPTHPKRPATDIPIVVYDTSSTTPVAVEARHLVIARPGDDGSRSVLDLIVLRNDGRRSRIAGDSLRPSWSGPLLSGTMGLELGEGDFSPDAVSRRGDSLYVSAPLAPGEKQVTLEYLVPAGQAVLELPFSESVPMLNVLTEENEAVVSGGTVALADSQMLQGRSFRRWTGVVPAGGSLRVALPGPGRAPAWLLAALVASVVATLSGAGWYFVRARSRFSPLSTAELLTAVANLDAQYAGREAETPDQEWRTYHLERARLKALLQASLAAGGPNR